MKKILRGRDTVLAVNLLLIAAVFVLNYFYQRNGFDYTLKCVCSSGFALLGLINLGYALRCKAEDIKFHVAMTAGLLLAMLGDVAINLDFIVGAGLFALGHVCFVAAYYFLKNSLGSSLSSAGLRFSAPPRFCCFSRCSTFRSRFSGGYVSRTRRSFP